MLRLITTALLLGLIACSRTGFDAAGPTGMLVIDSIVAVEGEIDTQLFLGLTNRSSSPIELATVEVTIDEAPTKFMPQSLPVVLEPQRTAQLTGTIASRPTGAIRVGITATGTLDERSIAARFDSDIEVIERSAGSDAPLTLSSLSLASIAGRSVFTVTVGNFASVPLNVNELELTGDAPSFVLDTPLPVRLEPYSTAQLSGTLTGSFPDGILLGVRVRTAEGVEAELAAISIEPRLPGQTTGEYVVTTVDDEIDAFPVSSIDDVGGPLDLSFREALALAEADGGPSIIRFDEAVFPSGIRTSIVRDAELLDMTINTDDLQILDEREAVRIDGSQGFRLEGQRIRLYGLEFLYTDLTYANSNVRFDNSSAVQVERVEFRGPGNDAQTHLVFADCRDIEVTDVRLDGLRGMTVARSEDVAISGLSSTGRVRSRTLRFDEVDGLVLENSTHTDRQTFIFADSLSNATLRDLTVVSEAGSAGSANCVRFDSGSSDILVADSIFQDCGRTGGHPIFVGATSSRVRLQNVLGSSPDSLLVIQPGGNELVSAPTIDSVAPVSGIARPNSTLEVYRSEGPRNVGLLGTTSADATGAWIYAGPIPSDIARIAVFATDPNGNTSEAAYANL